MTNTETQQEVTIYYLKMAQKPDHFKPTNKEFTIKKMENPIDPETFFKLYCSVGTNHQWTDRLGLTNKELSQIINDQKSSIYLLQHKDKTVGFSELVQEKDHVELLYFGLKSEDTGKGFGPSFLQLMINQAWSKNPQWIQLNTCSLDHPKALPLYLSKGFIMTESKTKRV